MADLPQPQLITRLTMSIYPPLALLAAMQLDLFTSLRDSPLPVDTLAERLDVDAARLRVLLYALVATGLLTEEGGCFATTLETATYLVRDRPYYVGMQHHILADLWQASLRTSASIRQGRPQALHNFLSMPRAQMESFFHGLHPGAIADGRRLAARVDFAQNGTVLDVGGGSGGVAIALVEAYPHLQVTIVDLPVVTPITRQFVGASAAASRIRIVSADFVTQRLTDTYDVVFMRSFTQVLPAQQVYIVLQHAHHVLRPGGRLYILARILDDSRVTPVETAFFNLVFINIYEGGQAYTESEYRDWLNAAGFIDCEREVLADGSSILSTSKPE